MFLLLAILNETVRYALRDTLKSLLYFVLLEGGRREDGLTPTPVFLVVPGLRVGLCGLSQVSLENLYLA